MIVLRRFRLADAAATHAVFFRAVREGAAGHYTPDELRAWAPRDRAPEDWRDRLADQITHVAEVHDELAGFATLDHSGHFDLIYVHPAHIRRGIGTALYRACLSDPAAAGIARCWTEASHLSRGFFAARGWRELGRRGIDRFGQRLTVFDMEKIRAPGDGT